MLTQNNDYEEWICEFKTDRTSLNVITFFYSQVA